MDIYLSGVAINEDPPVIIYVLAMTGCLSLRVLCTSSFFYRPPPGDITRNYWCVGGSERGRHGVFPISWQTLKVQRSEGGLVGND